MTWLAGAGPGREWLCCEESLSVEDENVASWALARLVSGGTVAEMNCSSSVSSCHEWGRRSCLVVGSAAVNCCVPVCAEATRSALVGSDFGSLPDVALAGGRRNATAGRNSLPVWIAWLPASSSIIPRSTRDRDLVSGHQSHWPFQRCFASWAAWSSGTGIQLVPPNG